VKPVASAVIIAHYHPEGLVRDDLRGLVDDLSSFADTVVFVSTHLAAAAAQELPQCVTIIVRENRGYDFYSYKVGIESLGDLSRLTRLFLVNSSFMCIDREKLLQRFFRSDHGGYDVFGLTRSHEHRPHLQSFLLSFGPRCLQSERFQRWWSRMIPIDDRQSVIDAYELGLSAYLRDCGFSMGSAYVPTPREKVIASLRSVLRLALTLDPMALNPTHFYWDFLLERFGIVKLELLERNPYGLNLRRLQPQLLANAHPLASGRQAR
jgi:lipopolysaccharide biosynthesis protein